MKGLRSVSSRILPKFAGTGTASAVSADPTAGEAAPRIWEVANLQTQVDFLDNIVPQYEDETPESAIRRLASDLRKARRKVLELQQKISSLERDHHASGGGQHETQLMTHKSHNIFGVRCEELVIRQQDEWMLTQKLSQLIILIEEKVKEERQLFSQPLDRSQLRSLAQMVDSTPSLSPDTLQSESTSYLAALLLRVIEKLAEPLLTVDQAAALVDLADVELEETHVLYWQLFVSTVPPAHRHLLREVLGLFARLCTKGLSKRATAPALSAALISSSAEREDEHDRSGAYILRSAKTTSLMHFLLRKWRECSGESELVFSGSILLNAPVDDAFEAATSCCYRSEPDLLTILVALHPYFCTDAELLDRLLEMLALHEHKPAGWHRYASEKLSQAFEYWVSNSSPFENPHCEKLLRTHLRGLPEKTRELVSKALLERYMKQEADAKLKKNARVSTFFTGSFTVDKKIDLLAVKPKLLAEQLTLHESELFAAVPVRELLSKAFMSPGHAPHYTRAVTNFNQIGLWIGTEILKHDSPTLRASIITRWLKVARHCVRLNNFGTAFAIICGLSQAPVARLKHSWKKIAHKWKLPHQHLDHIFDPTANHAHYREALTAASKGPVVPYLGFYTKMLFAIEEASNTWVSASKLNLYKLRLIWKVVSEIQSLQLFARSLEVEPRESKAPRILMSASLPLPNSPRSIPSVRSGSATVASTASEGSYSSDRSHSADFSDTTSLATMNTLLNALPYAALTTNEHGIILYSNPKVSQLLGFAPSELAGQNVKILIPEPTASRHDSYIERYLKTGEGTFLDRIRDVSVVSKNGSVPVKLNVSVRIVQQHRIMFATMFPLSDGNSSPGSATFADRARESVQKLAVAAVAMDDSGTILAFNRASEKLWGFSSAETFGRSVSMLMPPSIGSRHQSFVDRYLQTGITKVVGFGREVVMQKKSRDHCPVHLAVAESEDKGRRVFTAVIQPL